MKNIEIKEGITLDNAKLVCLWINKNEEMFRKWAGLTLEYPLLEESILKLENLYSIYNDAEFVGIIRKIRQDGTNIHIGNFLINPSLVGRGLGKASLKSFIEKIFSEKDIETISLNVLLNNKNAFELYKKCGFEIVQIITKPVEKYMMVLRRVT